ncbi:AtpZ/AtpI family protein [Aegicerativicinus sediminis]|uniref:AtpZ/AtpI family protein n=1 Tax=Aegicerativicinus sediminis TaxID=2893202 RepID=UPI001E2DD20E|nr:AtpZ/AtpI family protein [Aegicerativicinus sediminis]
MAEQDQPQGQRKKNNQLNAYAVYSSIAIQMAAIIAIGTYIGVKLDDNYSDGGNIFTIIFSLTSVILATIFVIRRIIAASKNDE